MGRPGLCLLLLLCVSRNTGFVFCSNNGFVLFCFDLFCFVLSVSSVNAHDLCVCFVHDWSHLWLSVMRSRVGNYYRCTYVNVSMVWVRFLPVFLWLFSLGCNLATYCCGYCCGYANHFHYVAGVRPLRCCYFLEEVHKCLLVLYLVYS